MKNYRYTVVESSPAIVALRDEQKGDLLSLTNAADYVVDKLLEDGTLTGQPLIYRDTVGDWDQLVYDKNGFKTFRFLNSRSFEEAKFKVLYETTGS